jgi:uncharacterized protein (TIGR03083 family)
MTGPHPPAFDFQALLRQVTGEFADAVRVSDLSAPVATCPGWQVRDLVGHLGRIHSWARQILDTGRRAPFTEGPVDVSSAPEASDWYFERAAQLCLAVQDLEFDQPCWNFSGIHQVRGFWPRRQVHETRMHLFDLDQATGAERPFDAALSADGVHEVFQVFQPRMAERGFAVDLAGPLRILATDIGMSWLLMPDADQGARLYPRGGDAPVAELSGTAPDLFRVLWNRPAGGEIKGEGDAEVLERFLASAHTP